MFLAKYSNEYLFARIQKNDFSTDSIFFWLKKSFLSVHNFTALFPPVIQSRQRNLNNSRKKKSIRTQDRNIRKVIRFRTLKNLQYTRRYGSLSYQGEVILRFLSVHNRVSSECLVQRLVHISKLRPLFIVTSLHRHTTLEIFRPYAHTYIRLCSCLRLCVSALLLVKILFRSVGNPVYAILTPYRNNQDINLRSIALELFLLTYLWIDRCYGVWVILRKLID